MTSRLMMAILGTALAAVSVLGQTPAATQSAAASPAVPKSRIAILSFLALREGLDELRQKYEILQAEFAPRANELDSLQSTIETKEKLLNENKNLTPLQARKLADEVEGFKKEYQRKLEDSQELARKREAEVTAPVLDKISDFLEKYCERHGITHVFDYGQLVEANAALYAAPNTNITEDFINEYNKANPVAAAAPKRP
ncbi:MAG: OmpH family outer membrane protein [Acidobacteria bacterium]|nr:OmpH family outer membrane protein [Acidobacteriota bacterium]MCW5967560.1 OmpH family outer membrane protein [Blastocatellales bacterium]